MPRLGTRNESHLRALLAAAERLGRERGEQRPRELTATPVLEALQNAGTRHVYADTADVRELSEIAEVSPTVLRVEIDGITANQPLVRKVAPRVLESCDVSAWKEGLRSACPDLQDEELAPWLYALLCTRIGNEIVREFAAGRRFDVSLQLHMGLAHDPRAAVAIGELLASLVPGALVKVPFAPDAPHGLLVARELERRGFPVNLTSTFSARQVAVAALLCGATRTNVFLGRINQGLQAALLGEHVVIESQRALVELRRWDGTRTELIAASLRESESFLPLAGCDAFTAPCKVLGELLEREPQEIAGPYEQSLERRYVVDESVERKLGRESIEGLFRIPAGLVEFLREAQRAPEWTRLRVDDGEELRSRFDEAGFGDLFHAPTEAERRAIERSKLPDLDGDLVGRLPLDTHYSLLANADFAANQAAIDAEIAGAAAEEPRT